MLIKDITRIIKNAKLTKSGFLIVSGRIAKVGIQEFTGRQLRAQYADIDINKIYKVEVTEAELTRAETITSYEGMPLTLMHPPDNNISSDNWKRYAIGHVQNVNVERTDSDIYLRATIVINDKLTIERIVRDEITELSCGYECLMERSQKQNIDFYKINISGNHVAVVNEGRSGPDVKLGDGFMSIKNKLKTMMQSIFGDEGESQTPAEVIKQIETQIEALEQSQTDESKEAVALLKQLVESLKTALKDAEGESDSQGDKKTVQGDSEETGGNTAAVPQNGSDLTGKNEEKLKEVITELQKTIVDKDAEIQQLKSRIEELEANDDLETTLGDARITFGDVAVKGKTAREVKVNILVD